MDPSKEFNIEQSRNNTREYDELLTHNSYDTYMKQALLFTVFEDKSSKLITIIIHNFDVAEKLNSSILKIIGYYHESYQEASNFKNRCCQIFIFIYRL